MQKTWFKPFMFFNYTFLNLADYYSHNETNQPFSGISKSKYICTAVSPNLLHTDASSYFHHVSSFIFLLTNAFISGLYTCNFQDSGRR